MPIEFRCPSCSKLLRTPDESAGKKAKCPQCGAIADVPLQSTVQDSPAGGSSAPLGSPTERPSDFVPRSEPPPKPEFAPSPFAGSVNPYATPNLYEPVSSADMASGEMRYTAISFERVLNTTWELFKQELGQMALMGLIAFAANMALQILGFITRLAAQQTEEVVVLVLVTIFNTLLSIVVNLWIQAGSTNFMLQYLRTGRPKISDFFSVGQYLISLLLLFLVYGMLLAVPGVLFAAPGLACLLLEQTELAVGLLIAGGIAWVIYSVYLWLTFLNLAFPMCLVIDRRMGVLDSMRTSAQFMRGNRLTAFLILLVVIIVGTLFICVTCTFGQILFIPYMALLTTVMYMMITGQPVVSARSTPAVPQTL